MVLVLIRLLFVYVGSFTLKFLLCFFFFFLPEVSIYTSILFSKTARLRT